MAWFVGVLCSCLGNSCVAASYTLQKLAHMRSSATSSVYNMPIWWVGILLMAPGEMGNFFALGMIPASVVAPLGSLTIMLNAISANKLLGETLQRKGYAGAAILMVGASLVISSTPAESPPTGLNELQSRFSHPAFVTYVGLLILAAFIGNFLRKSLIANVGLMGVIGCFCALSTKTVSYMLQTGDTRFSDPLALSVEAVLVTTVVMQIVMFQRVLSSFPVSQVVPLHFVTYTLMTSVGATLLYGELTSVPATNVMLFVVGSSLCFVGSYLVSTARGYDQQKSEYELAPRVEEY